MIETKSITVSKNKMFKLSLLMYIKMRKLIFLIYPLLIILLILKTTFLLSFYLILLMLISLITLPIYFYISVNSTKNRKLFEPYKLKFEKDLIWQFYDDCTSYSVKWEDINKVIKIDNFIALFYSQNEYILLDTISLDENKFNEFKLELEMKTGLKYV